MQKSLISLTFNIYYTGKGDNAKKFAEEMIKSGIEIKLEPKQETKNMSIFIQRKMRKQCF